MKDLRVIHERFHGVDMYTSKRLGCRISNGLRQKRGVVIAVF